MTTKLPPAPPGPHVEFTTGDLIRVSVEGTPVGVIIKAGPDHLAQRLPEDQGKVFYRFLAFDGRTQLHASEYLKLRTDIVLLYTRRRNAK